MPAEYCVAAEMALDVSVAGMERTRDEAPPNKSLERTRER